MNSCERHQCNYCCDTMVVPLLQEDIDRITRLGYPDYAFYQLEGNLRILLRIHDRCIFQDEEWGCDIYPFHPTWCKFYPLEYNPKTESVDIDRYCKHRKEFYISPELEQKVKAFVAWLAQEAKILDEQRKSIVRK